MWIKIWDLMIQNYWWGFFDAPSQINIVISISINPFPLLSALKSFYATNSASIINNSGHAKSQYFHFLSFFIYHYFMRCFETGKGMKILSKKKRDKTVDGQWWAGWIFHQQKPFYILEMNSGRQGKDSWVS